ncbi:MAG TPA: chemotaxis protein CheA [Bacillota bacterium]|nr:chemotaxis protein CheA [Bacillota bacterium]HOL10031.1 chemotaxis protein CheA [Bacillota bacterium]HPO97781.1 chemotaxis protein CheA [Bacillota bacterium]
MDISQYLNVFMDECREHLQTLNQVLLELEHNPDNSSLLDQIFRAAHTLKGASATMGFNKMANLTHAMEDVLSKLRSKEVNVTPEIVNILFEAVDLLESLANSIASGKEEDIEINGIVQSLRALTVMQPTPISAQPERRTNLQLRYTEIEKEPIVQALKEGTKLYHIEVTLSENCLLKGVRVFMVLREIEKFGIIVKSAPTLKDLEDEKFDFRFVLGVLSSSAVEEIVNPISNIVEVEKVVCEEIELNNIPIEKRIQTVESEDRSKISSVQTVRVDIKKLDVLMNLVAELVISRSRLESISAAIQNKQLDEVLEQVGRLTLELRDNVFKARMVPVETVFSRFPRLIRDLSRELKKEIDLEIYGGETELDRTVIDEIGDPLVHIIRNAADHGIESAEERLQKNKPEKGKIILKAYQEGNGVVIKIIDDGRGFDIERVKEKAVSQGLVSREALALMKDEEILEFTFLPGFSTAKQITEVSGRGVGMDVVKTKVNALGGFIKINSKFGEGTTIEIRLPLTLAIIQTLMVQLGNEVYAIPSGYIDQIISINKKDIKQVRQQDVFTLRGEIVPLIRLQHVLDTPGALNESFEELDVVVLKTGDRLVGCVVDGLMKQQDVVIKSLGDYLGTVKGIAGATILGNGKVALIIDIRAVA